MNESINETNKGWVRITSITIENLKNIEYGEITFTSRKETFNSSILGLYGQNGSGKTTLVNAIGILNMLLKGEKIPEQTVYLIKNGSPCANLKFCFEITYPDSVYMVEYSFNIRKEQKEQTRDGIKEFFPVIENEILKLAINSPEENQRQTTLINTTGEDIFTPATKFDELIGTKNKKTLVDMMVLKQLTHKQSQSFVFSNSLRSTIAQKAKENKETAIITRTLNVLYRISYFGAMELVVSTTKDTALLNSGEMNLYLLCGTSTGSLNGAILLNTERSCRVNAKAFPIVSNVIKNMNIVIRELVPGIQLELRDYGQEVGSEGIPFNRVQLLVKRDGYEIPLFYESEGTKKIISILTLLIGCFNHKSCTIVIDELDSGIFEYLLGELLKIISEQGHGQLIFTSHNLRPLETLDKSSIAFTTVNTKNRYTRIKNIMANNNLRDCYYREISIGAGEDALYDYTNNAKLAFAMRKAGGCL